MQQLSFHLWANSECPGLRLNHGERVPNECVLSPAVWVGGNRVGGASTPPPAAVGRVLASYTAADFPVRLRAVYRQTQDFVRPKGRQCFPTGQLPPHRGNTPLHVSNVVVVVGGRVVAVLVVVVGAAPVVVVVVAPGAVVVGQGLGEQLPGPAASPPWSVHAISLLTCMQSKAPPGDDRTQHRTQGFGEQLPGPALSPSWVLH